MNFSISLKTIIIAISIFLLIIIGGYTYHRITVNNLEKQLVQAQIDGSKWEYSYKLSDSLWKSFGGVAKFDSVYKTLGDIKNEIVKNNEKPILITQLKPQVIINNIPADTTKPDINDTTYRIAETVHPQGYYDLSARYQIYKPFNFEFSKIYVPDKLTLVTTKTPDNKIAVYAKNWNPFVKIDSVYTYIDPIMITQYKEIEKKTWKWITSVNTNFKSLTYSWFDYWNINTGIYAPFNFGINTGFIYNKPNDKVIFTIGAGYIYNF